MKLSPPTTRSLALLLALATFGCGSGASGDVSILVEPEDTIRNGLAAGDDVENLRDGWSATFEEYVVVVGHVSLSRHDATTVELEESVAIDLTRVPAQGLELGTLKDLDEGTWDFGYAIAGSDEVERHESVDEATFETVSSEGLGYFLRGSIDRIDGVSCPPADLVETDREPSSTNDDGAACYENPLVRFAWGIESDTDYGPCEIDGKPGVVVTGDRTATAAITVHGDHLFFNGFPEGEETTVVRRAQWLADCDLDLDGEVTRAELETIHPSDLGELEDVALGGSPITPLDSMWQYVSAQLKTQGHFNGEGECPADGHAHEH